MNGGGVIKEIVRLGLRMSGTSSGSRTTTSSWTQTRTLLRLWELDRNRRLDATSPLFHFFVMAKLSGLSRTAAGSAPPRAGMERTMSVGTLPGQQYSASAGAFALWPRARLFHFRQHHPPGGPSLPGLVSRFGAGVAKDEAATTDQPATMLARRSNGLLWALSEGATRARTLRLVPAKKDFGDSREE